MQFFTSLAQLPADFGPSAVTVGKFDGLHAGHRQVLAAVKAAAAAEQLRSVVLTFDRNPLSVLRPEACPDALVSNAQKRELLEASGVDATVMLQFDRAFSKQTPEGFVRDILVSALHARIVFVGRDFRFGAGGAGNVALLESLGDRLGFRPEVIEAWTAADGRRISASWIRQLLIEGDVAAAARLLGRLPVVRSVVVRGLQRGRALGFPTANLSPEVEGFIPADGVYAGWLTVAGRAYPAAVSVGNNPTFSGVPQRQVEAHVLGANPDLYDQTVEVAFAHRIREMVKFDSVPQLVAQMRQDTARAAELLNGPR